MNIGEEKVRSERTLLAGVEAGKYMMSADSVRFLVLHCSATRRNQDYSVEQLRRDHKARGFYDIGYHFYIRKDGTMTQHRKLLEVGAIIDALSASAMREDWMRKASLATLVHLSRLNVLSNCCISCISCFQKRRLWGIVTC